MMGVYEMTKGERRAVPEKKRQRPFTERFYDDLYRGPLMLTTIAPWERTKLLLQVQDASATITPNGRYKGIIDALVRVPQEQGSSALWRGNLANVLRTVPTTALEYTVGNKYKKFFLEGLDKEKDYWKFFAGTLASSGAAGVTGLCFVYPLEYAHTRLAADIGTGKGREFKGIADCLIKTVKSDGPRGVYRGFFVSTQIVFINRAVLFGSADRIRANGNVNFFDVWFKVLFANTAALVVTYPWDTVRRRMMMQSGRKKVLYKSALDCVQKIIKNEGMGAMFKGALAAQFCAFGSVLLVTIFTGFSKF